MSRRHSAEKREVLPDPKFGNIIITKFMNSVMYAGKKSVAEGIVYGALSNIESKTKQSPLTVFEKALKKWMPPASAAPPPRCGWRCVPPAARHWAFAGSSRLRGGATRRP